MRQGIGYTIAGLALSLGLMCASGNATGIEVERLETQKYPSLRDDIERVNLPYFDSANRVQWEGTDIPPPNYKVCPKPVVLRAVLARPRVDIWRCGNGRGFLAGISETGERRWVRELVYPSGQYQIKQHVLGANTSGLVLSTLDIWSPDTGKTLVEPPVTYFPSEQRAVPKFTFVYAAAYRASTGDYFTYDPGGVRFDGKGGVYRVHATKNTWERLMPAASKLLAPIDVLNIQFDASGRYLLLGERWGFRGQNWVRFVVFDLDKRRRVFEERHGEGTFCLDPRIVVGADGHIAFSYRSDSAQGREHVLVRYRIKPSN